MTTYIKNQNILDLWEQITNNDTFVAPYDGVLVVGASTSGYKYAQINDGVTDVWAGAVSVNGGTSACHALIKKGDTIKPQGSSFMYVRYYKLRDYTGRA